MQYNLICCNFLLMKFVWFLILLRNFLDERFLSFHSIIWFNQYLRKVYFIVLTFRFMLSWFWSWKEKICKYWKFTTLWCCSYEYGLFLMFLFIDLYGCLVLCFGLPDAIFFMYDTLQTPLITLRKRKEHDKLIKAMFRSRKYQGKKKMLKRMIFWCLVSPSKM